MGPDSAFYSEITDDPNGYLEPQTCRQPPPPAFDIDDAHDFSLMEGSVCDTDYFDQMASPGGRAKQPPPGMVPLAIDVDKYKIKPVPVARAQPLQRPAQAAPLPPPRLATIP